jgi:hypothetical protein
VLLLLLSSPLWIGEKNPISRHSIHHILTLLSSCSTRQRIMPMLFPSSFNVAVLLKQGCARKFELDMTYRYLEGEREILFPLSDPLVCFSHRRRNTGALAAAVTTTIVSPIVARAVL